MNSDVKQEFNNLLDTMTIDEIKKYRRRIIDGKIEGNFYVHKNCGCVYGTAAYVKGIANPRIDYIGGMHDEEYNDIETWIDSQKPSAYTPVEKYVVEVRLGETPDTNEILAALVKEIDNYLQSRTN